MQIQKFLVTSALYLAMAGGGVALADDRETSRKAASAAATTETRTHTVGDDRLRFSVKERSNLERYAASERERRADRDDDDDRDGGHKGKGGKDGKHKEGKQKPLPPGLQKKVARGGELPPGWQAKLARGEVMPAEVYQAAKPLSADVRKQYRLPVDPKGTVTMEVDGEIVRVVQDTREIIDILRGKR